MNSRLFSADHDDFYFEPREAPAVRLFSDDYHQQQKQMHEINNGDDGGMAAGQLNSDVRHVLTNAANVTSFTFEGRPDVVESDLRQQQQQHSAERLRMYFTREEDSGGKKKVPRPTARPAAAWTAESFLAGVAGGNTTHRTSSDSTCVAHNARHHMSAGSHHNALALAVAPALPLHHHQQTLPPPLTSASSSLFPPSSPHHQHHHEYHTHHHHFHHQHNPHLAQHSSAALYGHRRHRFVVLPAPNIPLLYDRMRTLLGDLKAEEEALLKTATAARRPSAHNVGSGRGHLNQQAMMRTEEEEAKMMGAVQNTDSFHHRDLHAHQDLHANAGAPIVGWAHHSSHAADDGAMAVNERLERELEAIQKERAARRAALVWGDGYGGGDRGEERRAEEGGGGGGVRRVTYTAQDEEKKKKDSDTIATIPTRNANAHQHAAFLYEEYSVVAPFEATPNNHSHPFHHPLSRDVRFSSKTTEDVAIHATSLSSPLPATTLSSHCPHCGKSLGRLPPSVAFSHPSHCAYRCVRCLRCGEAVTAKYLDDHTLQCRGMGAGGGDEL